MFLFVKGSKERLNMFVLFLKLFREKKIASITTLGDIKNRISCIAWRMDYIYISWRDKICFY